MRDRIKFVVNPQRNKSAVNAQIKIFADLWQRKDFLIN